ncbi:MAG TPA: GNAT family N-acetyltransferase, partial [Armatimonadota bacterium]|nr:GNAT family N-acetyltransferase [Armatimonadota bacterium]
MKQLRIIAPDSSKHQVLLLDLLAKTFSDHGYFFYRDYSRDNYLGSTTYDWNAARIGFIGDELVTHVGVWGYQMRIGTARVQVGRVGAICTHADFRKQGLMDQTMAAVLDTLYNRGYDMSILFGIPNYYHRYGYVSAWADVTHYCNIDDLPIKRHLFPIHQFTPRRRDDLDELYNACCVTATGTAVRPARYTLGATSPAGYLWKDDAGRTSGYVIYARNNNRLDCYENCGDVEQTLRILGIIGRRYHCHDVRFPMLPYTCDLAKRLRRGNCHVEKVFQQNGGAMIRTLNLSSTLTKLCGELSTRLQASHYADWQGNLLVADAREQVTLAITNQQVHVCAPVKTTHEICGGDSVAQLLIGTRAPEETVEASGMT